MNTLSVAMALLLLAAVGYLSPADAKTVVIPWGLKPSIVHFIHISVPTPSPHKTPTKPHKPPTKTPTKPATPTAPTPTPAKKPPPPPVSPPPSPSVLLPPPAPVVTGRRSLLATKKLAYPYRYLVEFSKSAGTYRFKTLTVSPGTKLMFRVSWPSYGSKGHHGLARTSTKYRCGHPLKTYLHPTSKKSSFTVTLPHKGTYHFYDPTLTPEPDYNKKHKVVGSSKLLYDCEHYFMSLTVKVT